MIAMIACYYFSDHPGLNHCMVEAPYYRSVEECKDKLPPDHPVGNVVTLPNGMKISTDGRTVRYRCAGKNADWTVID